HRPVDCTELPAQTVPFPRVAEERIATARAGAASSEHHHTATAAIVSHCMLQAACRGIAIVGNPVTIPILVPGVGGIVSRSLPPLGAVPFPDLAETRVADIMNGLPATVHHG